MTSRAAVPVLDKVRRGNPVLESQRLRLEVFGPSHLTDRYVGWLNDPEVCRHNRHGKGYTLAKAREYFQSVENSSVTQVFAIIEKLSGVHIGNISINDIDWNTRSGEISILMGEKQFWGRGLGGEAVRMALDFGFRELALQRMWIGFTADNDGMRRIAEKLQFSFCRTLPKAFQKEGREPVDVEEWEVLNPQSRGNV